MNATQTVLNTKSHHHSGQMRIALKRQKLLIIALDKHKAIVEIIEIERIEKCT
jgi:hypothetical protein